MNIIRVWGVFVDYKPMRQRRWSRALVRHGADARAALGKVLGLSAGDILVRGLTPEAADGACLKC
jgi:hypothetical protein